MSLNAMNFAESSGESSSSGREDGAPSSDTDSQYKKARFPWQIKGKHHLKNQADSQTDTPATASGELGPATPPPEPVTPPPERVVKSNRASLGNEAQTKRENCFICTGPGGARRQGPGGVCSHTDSKRCLPIESVITLAESLVQLSSYDGSDNYSPERNDLRPDPNPSVPVTARKTNEERRLSEWQANQIANCTFDNNINFVLESYLYNTDPADDRIRLQEIAVTLEDYPLNLNDGNVEDEAIQMAINAHGLRNMRRSNSISNLLTNGTTEFRPRYIPDDAVIDSYTTQNLEINNDWAYNGPHVQHEHRNSNQPEPSQIGEYSPQEFEFLNAAVIQAIKNKGLMTSGTDVVQ